MKITREELQAIENHMGNSPAVAGMYTPVLIAWCHALLNDNDNAYQRGAEAMREACLNVVRTELSDPWYSDELLGPMRALPIPEEP